MSSAQFSFAMKNRITPKIYINIGCLLDIPTAGSTLVTGAKGETIYNGGLGQITAIVGAGNNFKSTLLHYMTLSAAAKIKESNPVNVLTYDTEMNISMDRLEMFMREFPSLDPNGIRSNNPEWIIVDKSGMNANEFQTEMFGYMDSKVDDKKGYIELECFLDPYSKKPIKIPIPTFVEIDSFTQFEASSITDKLSGDLDSKDTNTHAMMDGMFKTKFLSQMPQRLTPSSTYLLLTAHVGDKIDMGMAWEQPSKKLQHLKTGDSIKSVGSKFSFLTNVLYQAHTASAFYNRGTKEPEYPKTPNDILKADLNKVTLRFLRNKNGRSGIDIDILISQEEGVLPTLTEFHFLRTNKPNSSSPGWGMSGNNRSFTLDIYPDVTLSRTTIRSLIDTDPLLRRAINITAEMLQLSVFFPSILQSDIWCSTEELYKDIKELGYDWNTLLDTRGYWTINQYSNKVNYLNTVDLLKMRRGLYQPWWLDKPKSK